MTDAPHQTTLPDGARRYYSVIESTGRGNRFMVVDNRGEAELGTWFIASTWWREDADRIARLLNIEAHWLGLNERSPHA